MEWDQQIDAVLKGNNIIRRNDTLVVDKTYDFLVYEGVENRYLAIPQRVVTKAKSGKDVSHSITNSKIRKIQDGIRTAPIVIHNPVRNALVFVSNVKQGGLPIIVSFEKNAEFDGDLVHKATSIHLQVDTDSLLENLPPEATVYVRNKKELGATVGVTNNLRSLSADIKFIEDIVAPKSETVKQESSENEYLSPEEFRERYGLKLPILDSDADSGRRPKFSVDDSEDTQTEAAEKPKKKATKPVVESKPIIAKKDLRKTLMNMFSIPDEQRAEMGGMIDNYADRLIKNGALTEDDRRHFFDRMYASGVMTVPADELYAEGRSYLKDGRIYVSDRVRSDFGDDWNDFRKRAFAAGIYLTNNKADSGVDVWNNDLDFVEAGMDSEDAYDLVHDLAEVEPEAGEDKVADVQLWRTCVDFSSNVGVQLAGLAGRMSESQYGKVQIAYDFGVMPDAYVGYYEIRESFDSDGNGSYSNAEVKAAIDSMNSYGLTRDEKAVLWQLPTGSKSAKNNPYSTKVGQQVVDARNKE